MVYRYCRRRRLVKPGNRGLFPIGRAILIKKFTKYWLPAISWMGVILWMSTETFSTGNTFSWVETILFLQFPGMSSEQAGFINFLLRRGGHVTEYFILGLLLFRAFRGGSAASGNWRWSFSSLVVVALWAAMDEFHQSFEPTRTGSIVDVGIDITGGILAQIVIAIAYRYRKK
jgi:VanZ family protein